MISSKKHPYSLFLSKEEIPKTQAECGGGGVSKIQKFKTLYF